ncbi:hypothetical protein [Flavobacterium sp.]|uniref:hypothetical protein n=1 Tax=Flavobacterium sp. TaxID=239 RepID=UPI00286A0DF6|nr:hypothetical protein [Flavobacterium sp.]
MKSKIITSVRLSGSGHEYQKKYLRMSKKIALLFVLFCVLSCKCKKAAAQTTAAITSECPKDGTCTIQLSRNKSMVVKKDEFGSVFYTLEESTSKSVVQYTYKRTVKGDIQDANYREEVVFEIDNNAENLHFSDAALENTQFLFGRFCFCRGQTGYYKINQGKLTVSKKVNEKEVDLNFKTDEVPQIIHHVGFSIK